MDDMVTLFMHLSICLLHCLYIIVEYLYGSDIISGFVLCSFHLHFRVQLSSALWFLAEKSIVYVLID